MSILDQTCEGLPTLLVPVPDTAALCQLRNILYWCSDLGRVSCMSLIIQNSADQRICQYLGSNVLASMALLHYPATRQAVYQGVRE
jgi:hypothetical protein